MSGIADVALGAAPIFGGALLGVAAGSIKGPDFRGAIKADLDLLDRIPEEESARRAALQRSINQRIDDLVAANQKSRDLRAIASSYEGNWRDIVLFICAVLFTIVWAAKEKHGSNWLLMLIVLIVICVLTAFYAFRGLRRSLATFFRRRKSYPDSADSNNP
jgi:ABC-type antimicrobial peptide transport system permease subunit